MPTDAEEVVNRFLAAWQSDDVDEALAFFADDAVWHNMPMDPAVGIEAIRELYVQFTGAMDGKAISLPICGVFEVQEGRIKSWRDYFDMSRFAGS